MIKSFGSMAKGEISGRYHAGGHVADDELKPAKALTIYEELKGKGMLLGRISGRP